MYFLPFLEKDPYTSLFKVSHVLKSSKEFCFFSKLTSLCKDITFPLITELFICKLNMIQVIFPNNPTCTGVRVATKQVTTQRMKQRFKANICWFSLLITALDCVEQHLHHDQMAYHAKSLRNARKNLKTSMWSTR